MNSMTGEQSICFEKPPYLFASASVAGKKEGEGPLGKYFDIASEDDLFGEITWELAEGTMQKLACKLALKNAGVQPEEVRYLFGGDLLRQGIATSMGAEELQIPVQLVLEQEKEEPSEPSHEELHPFLEEERSVEYLHYPMEGILAEHFIRIMRDMELINDMGSYYILYELLSKEMNSSRKVTEQIESLAKEQRIPLKKERFEMFEGYQNSSYMKKKWKSYLKKEKKKTPSFEEVMKVMIAYYRPIWDSLAEGNYYLGAWMPELMRYLD